METERSGLKSSEKVIYRCTIPLKLPSLNTYIRKCRANKYDAGRFKREWEDAIGIYLARLPVFQKPVRIHFHWVEENKRRDLDNVCYAKKHILDAMVKAGKLKDDNRRYVVGFTDSFSYEKEAKVIIDIEEVEGET